MRAHHRPQEHRRAGGAKRHSPAHGGKKEEWDMPARLPLTYLSVTVCVLVTFTVFVRPAAVPDGADAAATCRGRGAGYRALSCAASPHRVHC